MHQINITPSGPKYSGVLGWRENGRGKKVGGKKIGRTENWEENIIPYVAWMEEGKQGGKKTAKC